MYLNFNFLSGSSTECFLEKTFDLFPSLVKYKVFLIMRSDSLHKALQGQEHWPYNNPDYHAYSDISSKDASCVFHWTLQNSLYKSEEHNSLLNYVDASVIPRLKLINLSLTASFAILEVPASSQSTNELLAIICNPDFDLGPISNQIIDKEHHYIICDRNVYKHKHPWHIEIFPENLIISLLLLY